MPLLFRISLDATCLTLSFNTVYVYFHSHWFFVFIILNSNYFGRIQIYFKPVEMLFRAYQFSINPCYMAHSSARPPSSIEACYAGFSTEYVCPCDHVSFISSCFQLVFLIYILDIIKWHETNLFSWEGKFIIRYPLVDKTIIRVQQFTKCS